MNNFDNKVNSVINESKTREVKYSYDNEKYKVPYKMYYLVTEPNGDVYASTAKPWKYDPNWGFVYPSHAEYVKVGYTSKYDSRAWDDPMITIKHIKG